MCASPLEFRLAVLSVVGVKSVSAALHQHGECDSMHLHAPGAPISRYRSLSCLNYSQGARQLMFRPMCYCIAA